MITITKNEQMQKYYIKEVNTYVFNDDVDFLIDITTGASIMASSIRAHNINAHNIRASNISANEIVAFDVNAWNIKAWDIDAAGNIKAWNIEALNIIACDIKARSIKACNINYFAVCYAHNGIECNSIKGRTKNSKHFVINGELIEKGE